MTLLSYPVIIKGKLWGAVFTFEHAGDTLPIHTHTEADNHITVVLHGKIKCIGHERFDGTIIEAKPGGTILDWTLGEPHGFIGMTDGATLFQVLKHHD